MSDEFITFKVWPESAGNGSAELLPAPNSRRAAEWFVQGFWGELGSPDKLRVCVKDPGGAIVRFDVECEVEVNCDAYKVGHDGIAELVQEGDHDDD